jgi:hypothetical protein
MNRANVCETLFITAALLINSPAILAQHAGHGAQGGDQGGQISRPAEPSRTDRVGTTEGRVVSQSEDSITIEAARGGEPTRFVYALNERTEFRGTVRVGSRVSVTYVGQNGIRAATRVEGHRRRRGC